MSRWSLLPLLLLSLVACRPQIGDDCFNAVDCSPDGRAGRTCDPASPGGYCTISDCRSNSCPDEASCVAFRDGDFTFCMAACSSNEECRTDDGYSCLSPDEALGIFVVDTVSREDGATGYCGIAP